jgi:hypothetical protein
MKDASAYPIRVLVLDETSKPPRCWGLEMFGVPFVKTQDEGRNISLLKI